MDLKALYEQLPKGKENSLKVYEIANLWGVSNRKAREIMTEQMSDMDLMVISLGDGYFRPAKEEEIEAFYNYYNSYTCRMLKRRYRIKKARELWNQTQLNI